MNELNMVYVDVACAVVFSIIIVFINKETISGNSDRIESIILALLVMYSVSIVYEYYTILPITSLACINLIISLMIYYFTGRYHQMKSNKKIVVNVSGLFNINKGK